MLIIYNQQSLQLEHYIVCLNKTKLNIISNLAYRDWGIKIWMARGLEASPLGKESWLRDWRGIYADCWAKRLSNHGALTNFFTYLIAEASMLIAEQTLWVGANLKLEPNKRSFPRLRKRTHYSDHIIINRILIKWWYWFTIINFKDHVDWFWNKKIKIKI